MLSIIIPVLHEVRHLEQLLPELVELARSAEIIVVDTASGDGTADVIRRFPRVRYLHASRGRARQMNAGARAATGSLLLFLRRPGTRRSGCRRGTLRRPVRQPGAGIPADRGADERALAPLGNLHRRSSDLRPAYRVRSRLRLCRHPADGGYRAVPTAEATWSACVSAFTSHHRRAEVGARRAGSNRCADVGASLTLLCRRLRASPPSLVLPDIARSRVLHDRGQAQRSPGLDTHHDDKVSCPHNGTRRRRRALAITDTELKLIAALAMIGDSKSPQKG
jgi:glycosyltransferase involved in cell wall biosynthesis